MDPWQTGACFSHNPCVTPENNNPDSCSAVVGCDWDSDIWACVEDDSNNNFCDCWIQHTESSCDDVGGSWELPPWAEDCDGCDWIENECMIPMSEENCYLNFTDPCFGLQGYDLEILWDEETNTCTHTISTFVEGIWYVDGECLEIIWPEPDELECSELLTQETCYCFDCQWNNDNGECVDWNDGGSGRNDNQYKMKQYLDSMYKLNASYTLLSENRECYNYTQDCEGNIFLYNEFVDGFGGFINCIEVILTIINP